jgi:hypothetical protein
MALGSQASIGGQGSIDDLNASQDRNGFFKKTVFVLTEDDIDSVWNAENSNAAVQAALHRYFEKLSDKGQKVQDYNEFENRYEPGELKFIANYILSNLCFLKTELGINDA